MECLRTIVLKLVGWKGAGVSTCTEDKILRKSMMIVYLPEAASMQKQTPHNRGEKSITEKLKITSAAHQGKLNIDTSEKTSGKKFTVIIRGIMAIMEADRAGAIEAVDLLLIDEESVDDLDVDIVRSKADNELHESVMPKVGEGSLTVGKNSKH